MKSNFSWIEFYKEVHQKIHEEQYTANDLANIANQIFGNIKDIGLNGEEIAIDEMSPINFIAFFNRKLTLNNKILYCSTLKRIMNIDADVPCDFDGIPQFNNTNCLCMTFKKDRALHIIPEQWEISKQILENNINSELFDKILSDAHPWIGLSYLSRFCFIVKPEQYYPYDKQMAQNLGAKEPGSYNEYRNYCKLLQITYPNKTSYQLSHEAFEENSLKKNTDFKDYKEQFIQYMYSVGLKQSPSYSPFVKKKLKKDFSETIFNLSGAKIFEIDDVSILTKLIDMLKKLDDWILYNKNNGNGIPNAILNTHYKNFILSLSQNDKKTNKKEIKMDLTTTYLNQILYGPPGTGKTYNTVLKAMSIIDGVEYKDVSSEQYSELKNRFDELKQKGQIEFVTFHQSYSYEEFVEGIKPALENKDLSYKLEDGIFKQISSEALFASLDILEQDSQASFEFNHILEKFKELYPVGTAIKTEKSCFAIIDYLDTSIRVSPLESKHNYSVSYEPLEEMFKIHLDTPYSMSKDLADKFGSFKGLSTYYFNILEKLKEIHSEYSSKTSCIITEYTQEQKNLYIKKYHKKEIGIKNNVKPYILIIDEINRGDVSKIFGELITLIEEDKRIGNKYQMKTTLPYSKEPFGVPNNLYIIGTMNTADRSIALLDTALRRRFDFEEIMPRPELLNGKIVAGINLEQLLKRINERITEKYDRDHQIGHSYLMGVETEKDLERAYKNRILPLLNEYFYNDTKTVSQILNCSENELQNNFLDVLNKAQNS